ncbi:MAG: WG repeat-containing protein [Saprospiraceae bacterium]|nr:WG repeat-containing protein [Saprospiraceae bacterium]
MPILRIAVLLGFYLLACTNNFYHTHVDGNKHLFPIHLNNRHGFINEQGKVVIEPIFRDLGYFNNGLAPARINGSFGFINEKGVFVIPPRYDDVADFSEGLARVYLDGKLFFINTKGERQWAMELFSAGDFENGLARVSILQDSHRIGKVLDTLGRLHDPDEFIEWDGDLLIVSREVAEDEPDQVGVKHKSGKMIVPFGKYESISEFHEGFAEVSFLDTTVDEDSWDNRKHGFINRRGELVTSLGKGMRVFDNTYSEGLIAVYTRFDSNSINSDKYITWMDTSGKTVFVKKDDEEGTEFRNGRSFAGAIRNWYLMDKNGKQLSNNRFEWFADNDFSKNRVIVAEHDTSKRFTFHPKWGVIDSMGKYLIRPQYDQVGEAGFQPEGLLVAVADTQMNPKTRDPYSGQSYHWGLVDTLGNWLFKPKFTKVDPSGFRYGLLYAEIDDVYGYVNRKGIFVWKATKTTEKNRKIEPLNIAFMARGYNYVFPSNMKWRGYRNDTSMEGRCIARPIKTLENYPANQLGIIAQPERSAVFQKSYHGFKTYIYNTTDDTIQIDVQDNRLYLTMQALDKNGVWRDIEYSPSSWCGNSYYDVDLLPGEYWELTTPVYDGDIEATFRLAFYPKSLHGEASFEEVIYSNTFQGRLNPAQFWNKEGYSSTNLMDPYNE